MFLNRVKDERDAGRFEARGEQMMMAEYLADKRQWEESMARDVDGVLRGVEGDIEDDGMLPGKFCLGLVLGRVLWLEICWLILGSWYR